MDISLVYFPSAVILGALHALEPGHAKTLTAAFLIGTKGTKRDATILGLSVAATHSLIVIGLATIAVMIGREAFAGEASFYLSLGSSVVVVFLGAWLMRRRLRALRRASEIVHGHHHDHSHTPEPVRLRGELFSGSISIVDTPTGERFEMIPDAAASDLIISVAIARPDGTIESHLLSPMPNKPGVYQSAGAPAEPHEFPASIAISNEKGSETLNFQIHDPEHHHHDHALLSDEEHVRAHASDLPDYVKRGERPSTSQIIMFGAAGGLVPCPAAISVMLLSLSLDKTAKGLLLVLGFGLGLAVTLVAVGLIVVMGLSKLASQGRFSKLTAYAPAVSASLVMLSGCVAGAIAITHHP